MRISSGLSFPISGILSLILKSNNSELLNSSIWWLHAHSRLQEMLNQVPKRVSLYVTGDDYIKPRFRSDLVCRSKSTDCDFELWIHFFHAIFKIIRRFIELWDSQYSQFRNLAHLFKSSRFVTCEAKRGEMIFENFSGDRPTVEYIAITLQWGPFRSISWWRLRKRGNKMESKGRAFPDFWLNAQVSSHQIGELFGNDQSKSGAAIFSGCRWIDLTEGFKQSFLDSFLRNSNTGVCDGYYNSYELNTT